MKQERDKKKPYHSWRAVKQDEEDGRGDRGTTSSGEAVWDDAQRGLW